MFKGKDATSLSKAAAAKAAARSAKLHYTSDRKPGISRLGLGKSWRFIGPDGATIKEPEVIERINKLAIPPAYKNVWISPDPDGHLQATGIDARGRKQYRYHAQWRQVRDSTKYEHVLTFARVLPKIRLRVDQDLKRHGLPKEKVLATVIRLMETTLVRVGNQEYARDNKSFGLTTLRNRHVTVSSTSIHLNFRAKSGIHREIDVRNAQLARVVKRLRELPGQELFQYVDQAGSRHAVHSNEVNDYLKAISGEDITAKDFRTWAGTRLAAMALSEVSRFDNRAATKKAMLCAIEKVAERLGNTPSICRKCYIHPAVLEAYMDGDLAETTKRNIAAELTDPYDLSPEEAAIMALLERRLANRGHLPDDSKQNKRLREKLHASILSEQKTLEMHNSCLSI